MPGVTPLLRSVTTLPPNQSCGIDAYYATLNFCAASFNDAVYAHQRRILRFAEVSGFSLRALVSCGTAEHGRRLEGVGQ
jgi:hypothetical protein